MVSVIIKKLEFERTDTRHSFVTVNLLIRVMLKRNEHIGLDIVIKVNVRLSVIINICRDHAHGTNMVGRAYLDGTGVEKEKKKEAADRGHVYADLEVDDCD